MICDLQLKLISPVASFQGIQVIKLFKSVSDIDLKSAKRIVDDLKSEKQLSEDLISCNVPKINIDFDDIAEFSEFCEDLHSYGIGVINKNEITYNLSAIGGTLKELITISLTADKYELVSDLIKVYKRHFL